MIPRESAVPDEKNLSKYSIPVGPDRRAEAVRPPSAANDSLAVILATMAESAISRSRQGRERLEADEEYGANNASSADLGLCDDVV